MRGFFIGNMLMAAPLRAVEPLAIQDNSFLIEEAYNQERGVVQHIFTFSREGGESVGLGRFAARLARRSYRRLGCVGI